MATIKHFPVEIFETIIDFLAGEDKPETTPSLKACALVSHDFLPLARNHIFSSITLNLNDMEPRSPGAQMFTQLISHTPEIAIHIRTLRYYVLEKDYTVEGFPEAFKKLTRLTSLAIVRWKLPLIWSEMFLPLRGAFLQLLHLPTLRFLELCSVHSFILSDLSLCSNLECLTILDVRLCRLSEQEEALRLVEYSEVLNNSSSVNIWNVRRPGTLTVRFYSGPSCGFPAKQNSARDIIKQCVALMNIQSYTCNIARAYMIKGYSDLLLPCLPTLRQIYFELSTNSFLDGSISNLAAELDAMSGKNIIRSIKIYVTIQLFRGNGVRAWHHEGDWAVLDKVLTTRQPGWKHLETLSIRIILTSVWGPINESVAVAMRKLVEGGMKGLFGSIRFDYEVVVST